MTQAGQSPKSSMSSRSSSHQRAASFESSNGECSSSATKKTAKFAFSPERSSDRGNKSASDSRSTSANSEFSDADASDCGDNNEDTENALSKNGRDKQKSSVLYVSDGTHEFRKEIGSGHEKIFSTLRSSLFEKERMSRLSSLQMIEKAQKNFTESKNLKTVESLKLCQKLEIEATVAELKSARKATDMRKNDIFHQMYINAKAESHDNTLMSANIFQNKKLILKNKLDDLRGSFEKFLSNMKQKHVLTRKLLTKAQEREFIDSKSLIQHETLNMTEEKRNAKMKSFQFVISQKKFKNKKMCDQLRVAQELEIRQSKDRFDLEARIFEEIEILSLEHSQKLENWRRETQKQIQKSEIGIQTLVFSHKAAIADLEQRQELLKIMQRHSNELRLLEKQFLIDNKVQEAASVIRMKQITSLEAFSKTDSNIPLLFPPANFGICAVIFGLVDGIIGEEKNHDADDQSIDEKDAAEYKKSLGGLEASASETPEMIKQAISRAEHEFKLLLSRHAREHTTLKNKQMREFSFQVSERQKEIFTLESQHKSELETLRVQQLEELHRIEAIQRKESDMEENIINTEKKMLTERKLLSMIFMSIVDCIIIIDVRGIITTFNSAAEKIFGYTAQEIIGKNIHILQPDNTVSHHDTYIALYLRTGIKKVIGHDRKVQARHKDGHLVTVALSLSEIKDKGIHLFTAVLRETTSQEKLNELEAMRLEAIQKKIREVENNLIIENARGKALYELLVPRDLCERAYRSKRNYAEVFDNVTIIVTEIYKFGDVIAECPPSDIILFMEQMESSFDEIIEEHGLYVTDIVGDAYTCVCGISENDKQHPLKIAKAAIAFNAAINKLRMASIPETALKLKIGIHTGPVVAGIMGKKLPRFKVHGDSLHTACRIRSTASPGAIHVSEEARQALLNCVENKSTLEIICKGEIEIKGKKPANTFSLEGIRGFGNLKSL